MSVLDFIAAGLAGAAIAIAALMAGVWLCRRISRPNRPPVRLPPGPNPWG